MTPRRGAGERAGGTRSTLRAGPASSLVSTRGRAPLPGATGQGWQRVCHSASGGTWGSSRRTQPTRGSSWTEETVRVHPGRKHGWPWQARGLRGPGARDGGRVHIQTTRPPSPAARFVLSLGTGHCARPPAGLGSRRPRPRSPRSDADASAPSPPRRSNLSSPSITLPATPGDPRDTQRTAARGHRGRSVGRAQREA